MKAIDALDKELERLHEKIAGLESTSHAYFVILENITAITEELRSIARREE